MTKRRLSVEDEKVEDTGGWWTLTSTCELNDMDREHIANCIIGGTGQGEIVHDGEDDENDQ